MSRPWRYFNFLLLLSLPFTTLAGDDLESAARRDNAATIRNLVAAGADVNARFGSTNRTALHIAARYGRQAAAEALIPIFRTATAPPRYPSRSSTNRFSSPRF